MLSKIHPIQKRIMITIENRKTEIVEVQGQPETLRYSDIMKMIMEIKPADGQTTGEMKNAFRVIDFLESVSKEHKESFELEEEDYKLFLHRYPKDTFVWGVQHRDVTAFDDYIRSVNQPKPE